MYYCPQSREKWDENGLFLSYHHVRWDCLYSINRSSVYKNGFLKPKTERESLMLVQDPAWCRKRVCVRARCIECLETIYLKRKCKCAIVWHLHVCLELCGAAFEDKMRRRKSSRRPKISMGVMPNVRPARGPKESFKPGLGEAKKQTNKQTIKQKKEQTRQRETGNQMTVWSEGRMTGEEAGEIMVSPHLVPITMSCVECVYLDALNALSTYVCVCVRVCVYMCVKLCSLEQLFCSLAALVFFYISLRSPLQC